MRLNDLFQLSKVTELQIVNMPGEKVNGFFNICVYSLSSVSLVSTSTETVGTQKYASTYLARTVPRAKLCLYLCW